MDWNKGYTARYYASVVDRKTLRDCRDKIDITGGSIKREDSDLRESADFNCVNYNETSEQLIRIWLDARQGDDSSHIPLFTGIATSPERNINGRLVTNTVECYSILKIVQDMLLQRGWYVPAGVKSGDIIRSLLSPLPVKIDIPENSPGLKSAIIAENGENRLSMTDKILSTMKTDDGLGWRLFIDGYGNIKIRPYSRDPVATFDSLNNDVLELSLSVTNDWYECPNVYRAILGDSYSIARDDSPNSIYSTVNRGREVWYEDSSVYLSENQTLADYARSMLDYAQKTSVNVSYDRRFNPDVTVSDAVRINYQEQKINGLYFVSSQTIELGYNAKTSEEVIQIEQYG